MDALLNPKVLIDRPVSLRSTSFELQAREGLYEDKKNDCQLDDTQCDKIRKFRQKLKKLNKMVEIILEHR